MLELAAGQEAKAVLEAIIEATNSYQEGLLHGALAIIIGGFFFQVLGKMWDHRNNNNGDK